LTPTLEVKERLKAPTVDVPLMFKVNAPICALVAVPGHANETALTVLVAFAPFTWLVTSSVRVPLVLRVIPAFIDKTVVLVVVMFPTEKAGLTSAVIFFPEIVTVPAPAEKPG